MTNRQVQLDFDTRTQFDRHWTCTSRCFLFHPSLHQQPEMHPVTKWRQHRNEAWVVDHDQTRCRIRVSTKQCGRDDHFQSNHQTYRKCHCDKVLELNKSMFQKDTTPFPPISMLWRPAVRSRESVMISDYVHFISQPTDITGSGKKNFSFQRCQLTE